jgi:hypothetical protein
LGQVDASGRDEARYFGQLVNTMTDTFAESHRTTALIMAAIFVMGAATFDLVDGAVSENPLLFIAGVLFFGSAVLLFGFCNQNPR